MKDIGKIKDSYDFSLDSRQLGLVVFGAVIFVALVFVLGMSVGRRWEEKKQAEQPVQAAAAPAQAPVAAPPTVPEVVPVPEPIAPPVAPPVTTPAAVPAAQPEKTAAAQTQVVGKPAPGKPGMVSKPETAKKPATAPQTDLTFPKVLTSNSKKTTPLTPEKKPAGRDAYTVQVGAFNDKAEAQQRVDKLKKKGYAARVVAVNGPGGETLYKVRVGKFVKREEAATASRDIGKSEGGQSFITIDK